MTEDQIKDHVRQSTDSSIQALTAIVRSIQEDNRRHREEELESREIYRDKLIKHVEQTVTKVVNGKIDSANKKLDMLIDRTAPVIKQYEDTKTTWSTIKKWSLQVGIIAALITGAKVLLNALSK